MFKLSSKKSIRSSLKGIFMSPIQHEVRVPIGDWSAYFGKYQNQKWGFYDTNSCWALSAINCVEDQLEWLWKNRMFTPEAKAFFQSNGYIDGDGDFSCSERYLEILSGVKDGGNGQEKAWMLMQKYGVIPRKDLSYSQEQADSFGNHADFIKDYFNPNAITLEMRAKGQEFLKHVNVSYQWIGKKWTTPAKEILREALKQAPIQIGIPVPQLTYLWNYTDVLYDGSTAPAHAVELYAIDEAGKYLIFDQYEPHIKRLSADYYIPLITQGILAPVHAAAPNPVPQVKESNSFWTMVTNWWNGIIGKEPVGSIV